jgi:hypothetical protein
MSNEIPDPRPLTNLDERAIQLHEMYSAYMEAGFPEHRAFELVTIVLLHYLETD